VTCITPHPMMNDRERWITKPRLAKRESAARLGSRWTNGEPPAACDEGDRGRSYQFGVVADVELFQLLAVFRFPWACRLEQPGSLPDEIGNQRLNFPYENAVEAVVFYHLVVGAMVHWLM